MYGLNLLMTAKLIYQQQLKDPDLLLPLPVNSCSGGYYLYSSEAAAVTETAVVMKSVIDRLCLGYF